jgi:SAM-dependent methyltransferase
MTTSTVGAVTAPDLAAIKAKQQVMWASGDFAVIGTTLQIVGETLCEAIDLRSNERVLDVAAGNGNATLAAARRFSPVTSTDYVPELLERGRQRAEAERLDVTFQTADAEALPFADGSFDVILSTFGVMFAPDHAKSASELLRVCRRGGRIGLACWTPEGFLGKLFKVVASYVPPAPGVQSPLLWGSEGHLGSLFTGAASIVCARRDFAFRYRSAEHWIEIFRDYYGPVHKAFAALDTAKQAAFEADLIALLRASDRGSAAGLVVPAEYLEIVVTR